MDASSKHLLAALYVVFLNTVLVRVHAPFRATAAAPVWFIALAESASYQSFACTKIHKIMQGHSLEVSFKYYWDGRQ